MIDKNIPLPSERTSKYPVRQLELGESFFAPNISRTNIASSLQYAAGLGRKFATRRVTEDGVRGLRVWRIA